jgi:DNA-binding NtrC family response regulator
MKFQKNRSASGEVSKKSGKILLALSDRNFLSRVVKILKSSYTIYPSMELRDFSEKVHSHNPDVIVVDYHFAGMKAEDLYQGIEFLHPNAVFVIYARRATLNLAKSIWKRRAMDYIYYTSNVLDFMADVHKVVRYVVEKKERLRLQSELALLKEQIGKVRKKSKGSGPARLAGTRLR